LREMTELSDCGHAEWSLDARRWSRGAQIRGRLICCVRVRAMALMS
jgi:hypothetical protein